MDTARLKQVLYSEIEGFREIGHKFRDGEIKMMDFKHHSGGFGVYAHREGKEFMIRLRIPSGMTNIKELKKVYQLIKRYNVPKIHFTTRQAIQFHGLSIDDVCHVMKEALDVDIYTRGSGGNFPRNVALSPLAGVNPKEAFDPTPYALAVGNYFLERIYTYHLPRKLKVSFSSSDNDGAHCTIQDLGFLAVNEGDKNYFQVYLGGGLGQNPRLAVKYPELIEPEKVLYYVEAMVKFFMAEGDYENRSRARVRYILERMGEEKFISEYKSFVEKELENGGMDINPEPINYYKPGKETSIQSLRLYGQKQPGLYSVYLHPIGGQLSAEEFKKLIDILENIPDADIRLAMTEGLYIRNLNGDEAEIVLKATESMGEDILVKQSVSCIGAPICQIGMGNSQQLLRDIIKYLDEKKYNKDFLPRIQISGCPNSCGIHQAAAIGFTGKKKKVGAELTDCFTLYVDGSFHTDHPQIGKSYGEIPASEIPQLIYEMGKVLEEKNIKFTEYMNNNTDELDNIISGYRV